jgi:hypothetical protein
VGHDGKFAAPVTQVWRWLWGSLAQLAAGIFAWVSEGGEPSSLDILHNVIVNLIASVRYV